MADTPDPDTYKDLVEARTKYRASQITMGEYMLAVDRFLDEDVDEGDVVQEVAAGIKPTATPAPSPAPAAKTTTTR